MVHAGVYSGGDALPAKRARGAGRQDADGAKASVAKMKEMPTDDPLFGKGNDPCRRPQDPSGAICSR